MIGNIHVYILISLLASPTLSISLTSALKEPNTERQLSMSSMVDTKIVDESYNMSIEVVRNQIIDLHKNVKLCMDLEFSKEPNEIMDFDAIIEACAGDNFSVILRYYEEMSFAVKEVIKEKIKAGLGNGFCDNILFMCIQFFKMVNLFIDLDYDLMKSLELSNSDLKRRITKDKLETMIDVTKTQVSDYEALKQHMADERSFMASYFNEKKELYENKYAHLTYVKEDSLIDSSAVSNPTENLTTNFVPGSAKIDTGFVDKVINGGTDLKSELMSFIKGI